MTAFALAYTNLSGSAGAGRVLGQRLRSQLAALADVALYRRRLRAAWRELQWLR